MHFETNDAKFGIKDIEFIRAESLDMPGDCLLLRISLEPPDKSAGSRSVDALVKLDIVSYIPPLDGSNLIDIIAKGYGDLPHTLKEYLEWYSSLPKVDEES